MAAGVRGRLSLLLVARFAGGGVGALAPVYALLFLDRGAYGAAVADVALTLLLCGPIAQYVGQGYMRDAIAAEREGRLDAPRGAALVHLFLILALAALAAAAAMGALSLRDALLIAAMSPLYLASRIQESHLVAQDRQLAAVTLVYIAPPLLSCILMGVLQLAGMRDHFMLVALALVGGALAGVLGGLWKDKSFGRRLAPPPMPRSLAALRAEWASVVTFATHGALLSACEQLPVVALRWLGVAEVVPAFELARKIASVPGVIVHALLMHVVPRMSDAVRASDWAGLRAMVSGNFGVMTAFGLGFAACAWAGVAVLQWLGVAASSLSMAMLAPMLAAACVTAAASPFGAASLALEGERWWVVGGGLGLPLQALVTFVGFRWLSADAVAWGILAQALALHGFIAWGVLVDLARRARGVVDRPAGAVA